QGRLRHPVAADGRQQRIRFARALESRSQDARNHEVFQDVPRRIGRLAVVEGLFTRRALAIADFPLRMHLYEYDSSPIGPAKTGFEEPYQRKLAFAHLDRIDSYHRFPFLRRGPQPPPPAVSTRSPPPPATRTQHLG